MNIQSVSFNNISFINIPFLGELEIKYLKKDLGFSPLHIEDYINRTQSSKIEITKDYALIVLDIPSFCQNHHNGHNNNNKTDQKKSKSPIDSAISISKATLSYMPFPHFASHDKTHDKKRKVFSNQVDFFIGKDYLVVLNDGSPSPINNIFSLCQKTLHARNEFLGQGPVYLAYRIIDALVDTCFPIVNSLSNMIDKIDTELEERESDEKILEDISITRRNIVVFHTLIKPIISLFKHLKEGRYQSLNGIIQPLWGNVLDHLQIIWERVEDNRELIEGISESNESFLSSKTNKVIKILTVFSATVLPLNLIASIYGMNIQGLPFAQNVSSFVILLIIMFIIAGGMLIVFKLKRWF